MAFEKIDPEYGKFDRATIFSSAAFCRVWAEAFGMRWRAVGPNKETGVTYISTNKLALREYHLSSHGLPWGSVRQDSDLVESFLLLAVQLTKEWNCYGVNWNFRYDSKDVMQLAKQRLQPNTVMEKYVHILDLEGESAEHYLNYRIKPVTKRQIRLGNNAGLSIRRLSTQEDFDKHDLLYTSWAQTRGVTPRPLQLFREINSELADSSLALGAFKNGKMIAAVYVFHDDLEWFYWHGVRDMLSDRFYATDVLLEHAIRLAVENGARYFNMGGSGGIASLEAFKERWGARKTSIWQLQWRNPIWNRFLQISKRIRGIG